MQQKSLYQIIYCQNQRRENMDRYLVESKVLDGVTLRLFAVCDGVGSTPRGGEVAQDVVNGLWNWFTALDSFTSMELLQENLLDCVASLNESLWYRERNASLLRGATTISVLLLVENTFFVLHLGDSRIYAREEGGWVQLTKDHEFLGALTECLPKDKITPYCLTGERGFTHYLLASDGFYRRLNWGSLEDELPYFGENKQFLSDLKDEVIDNGEKDNITAIMFATDEDTLD